MNKNKSRSLLILMTATFATVAVADGWIEKKVKQTVQGAINIVVNAGQRTSNSMAKILHNPIEYALELPEKTFHEGCASIAQVFRYTFQNEAKQWYSLPPEIIQAIDPFYTTDLNAVAYAVNIRTNGPEAVTLGKLIYVSHDIDWTNYAHVKLMMHELEHTEHFQGESRAAKLCEYSLKAVGAGLQWNEIDWEQAANRKSDYVMEQLRTGNFEQLAPYEVLVRNNTNVSVAFAAASATSDWMEFRLDPGAYTVISDTANSPWYNLQITTGTQTIEYSFDGRDRVAIAWNQNGVLDFFRQ
jgi:hypothetical protein